MEPPSILFVFDGVHIRKAARPVKEFYSLLNPFEPKALPTF